MKHLNEMIRGTVGRINYTHVQLAILVGLLVLFALAAGAPDTGTGVK